MPYVASDQDVDKGEETALASSPSKANTPKPPQATTLTVIRLYWRVLASVTGFTFALSVLRKARELLFPIEGHARDMSQDTVGYVISVSYAVDALLFPVAGRLLDTV